MPEVSLRERVYRMLCDAPQPLTIQDIADRMDDDKRKLGETLRKLSHRNLVKLDHRHWRALRPDVPPKFGPRSGGTESAKAESFVDGGHHPGRPRVDGLLATATR